VTILTHIRHVEGSNLGRDTDNPAFLMIFLSPSFEHQEFICVIQNNMDLWKAEINVIEFNSVTCFWLRFKANETR
jgi:hypothetical protein